MRIYQLIYTSVKHSLTDASLGLENKPGYKVYSCSEGLTKDEINEIVRFCGYRLPKNCEAEYPETPFEPSIPDMFPKMFRTLKLDSGRYAAIQVSYAGYDWNGDEGNFFAHALIADGTDEKFYPELLFGSEMFRCGLTPAEAEAELVRYLPSFDTLKLCEELSEKVDSFVSNHKIQMSSVLEQVIPVITGGEKTHICISAKTQEESAMYVLGLKRILPPGISESFGVSTNNVFLPSSGQNKIIINGTVTGNNNITDEAIAGRESCVYIDVHRIETDGVKPLKLFEMSVQELHKSFDDFSIRDGNQLVLWLHSFEHLNEPGIGDRLRNLYDAVGKKLFAERAESLYGKLGQNEMAQVRYEVLEVMNEHLDLFPDKAEELLKKTLLEGIKCICEGEPKNVESILKNADSIKTKKLCSDIDSVMNLIDADTIEQKTSTLLLRIFAIMKAQAGINTWMSFFKSSAEYLSAFTLMCAQVMISDTLPVVFTAPAVWTERDVAEAVAFIDASTDDEDIRKACAKYVIDHKNEQWSSYGITMTKVKKSKDDADNDMMHIRKMLTAVGYVPYQRTCYRDLKFDVLNEISTKENPLLLVRLLYSVYSWQGSSDREEEAEKSAMETAELINEMKETELSCYRFVFPKLALEILESDGYYHELIINTQTMEDDFWNWFYIGWSRSSGSISENYEKVFLHSQNKLKGLSIYNRLNNLIK